MRKLKLKVTQPISYKVATIGKRLDDVTDNLLNQNFNPIAMNNEGWIYLAIVIDLVSLCIIVRHSDKPMTIDLIGKV